MFSRTLSLLLALTLIGSAAWARQEANITVDAAKVENHISPFLCGSCIEDVNHEIYGGLYDQRLFGESFEEPLPGPTFAGWTTLGGVWSSTTNGIAVAADAGAKLVRQMPAFADGTIETDITFRDNRGENAGVLVRVSGAGVGADNFDGYEISLSARDGRVRLGKHHHDYHLLQEITAPVVVGTANHLRVAMEGPRLRVYVNGEATPRIDFLDRTRPLLTGTVALRTWNADAAFANVQVGNTHETFRSVARPAISGMWDAVQTGTAVKTFRQDSTSPYNGTYFQKIERGAGSGIAGIANKGLNRWGIAARKGQAMAGRVYLLTPNLKGSVTVALQSADGTRTYARQTIPHVTANWAPYTFSLTPTATDPDARFALWIDQPGSLSVDQATLTGTGAAQFHGLPLRADIATKIQQEGITFLRYGGTMVNAPEYRWKKMIGDRDRRPPYPGHWYPYSTNGFGIEEFLQFCEAAHIEPAFAINIEETAQDAADLVEYLNGTATSVWGRRRAQNGHPAPYHVRYIEIGNEEVIESDDAARYDHYVERFEALYTAMHTRAPKIQFVNAAWWRPESPNMARVFQALNGKAAYWDLHPWADDPRAGIVVDKTLTQMHALFTQWDPKTTMKSVIFEENGGLHNQQRALGHATVLNAVRRHGDFVLTSCPANALQPLDQNDNGWDQGQIFFTPSEVWGMPPYFAQQMEARNYEPLRVGTTVTGDLDVTATRSADGKTLILHVINVSAAPLMADVKLENFTPTEPMARVEELASDLAATAADAQHEILPRYRTWRHGIVAGSIHYTFAPHSVTILRFTGRTIQK